MTLIGKESDDLSIKVRKHEYWCHYVKAPITTVCARYIAYKHDFLFPCVFLSLN